MDISTIKTFALVIGLILGTLVIIASFVVYLKRQKSDVSTICFAILGLVLLGMSIWTTVEVSLPIGSFQIINGQMKANEKRHESVEKEFVVIWQKLFGVETLINQIKTRGEFPKEIETIEELIRDIKARKDVIDSQFQEINATNSATKLMLESLAESIGMEIM